MVELNDTEFFMQTLVRELNMRALEVAEPHIQKALKEIERDMRERVAARLIGMIDERVRYHHNRQELVIQFGAVNKEGTC